MDCAESVAKLSEYHDEELAAEQAVQVRAHLAACAPCDGVYRELDEIVVAASSLGVEASVSYPNEDVLWQRLAITNRIIH